MRVNNPQLRIKKQPWYASWRSARRRCIDKNVNNYHRYGGRGIKFDIPFWYMGVLFYRDNAHLMKNPSIDRIDNDGDYTFANCRFIEFTENSRRSMIGNKRWLGKKHSAETKRKMGLSGKGRKASAKAIRNNSIAQTGNKHSEETKRKMSLSRKAYLNRQKNEVNK